MQYSSIWKYVVFFFKNQIFNWCFEDSSTFNPIHAGKHLHTPVNSLQEQQREYMPGVTGSRTHSTREAFRSSVSCLKAHELWPVYSWFYTGNLLITSPGFELPGPWCPYVFIDEEKGNHQGVANIIRSSLKLAYKYIVVIGCCLVIVIVIANVNIWFYVWNYMFG